MLFGEKLKQLRLANGYTQEKTAGELGVTVRAYQNYEACRVYPKNTSIFGKVAAMFSVTADYLLSDEDRYIIDASERGGSSARKDVAILLSELGGFFAGGEFTEDDKDKVMRTINDLYWKAKESNKKYSPVKFRRDHVAAPVAWQPEGQAAGVAAGQAVELPAGQAPGQAAGAVANQITSESGRRV